MHAEAMSSCIGVPERILWLSFPDHANIGDSAIWLGARAWAAKAQIASAGVLPIRATSPAVLHRAARAGVVPMLRGGGFFGGLYPSEDRLRIDVARAFSRSKVVQGAQSVHEADPRLTQEEIRALRSVKQLNFFVRDHYSEDFLRQRGVHARVIPDAAHLLGMLSSAEPRKRAILLVRQDDESPGHTLPKNVSFVDWPRERAHMRRVRQTLAVASRYTNFVGVPGVDYDRVARARLQRGISLLAEGETVVTDRLHAMIIGLHMGRRVIAVDNKVKKLSRYRDAWLADLPDSSLTLVNSMSDALEAAA